MNPEFIEGKETRKQILGEFLNNFKGVKGNRDGVKTKEEFFDYFTDLSMNVPSDEYFVRMMESSWQCPEEDNDGAVIVTVQMILNEVRTRLLELFRNNPKFLRKVKRFKITYYIKITTNLIQSIFRLRFEPKWKFGN